MVSSALGVKQRWIRLHGQNKRSPRNNITNTGIYQNPQDNKTIGGDNRTIDNWGPNVSTGKNFHRVHTQIKAEFPTGRYNREGATDKIQFGAVI